MAPRRCSYLPAELLPFIATGLKNPLDITRFRSVCRQWRLTVSPPPPNKLSPFFPLRFSLPSSTRIRQQSHLFAGAVYLFRHHRDPSKSWLVSLHESQTGKLVPRHALTSEPIPGLSGNHLDLLEWSATQIHTCYSYSDSQSSHFCHECRQITRTMKVVFVSKSDFNRDVEAVTLTLCSERGFCRDLRLTHHSKSGSKLLSELEFPSFAIDDFVNFNGRIYAVDALSVVYVLDCKTLQLIEMEGRPELVSRIGGLRKRLVVMDGELHVVGRFQSGYYTDRVDCLVYKLVMDEMNVRGCRWERVGGLGDRVLFINRNCSFLVSASDLPRPWKGNCVVAGEVCRWLCGCSSSSSSSSNSYEEEILVFDLGVGITETLMSSLRGYSDLFTPPPF